MLSMCARIAAASAERSSCERVAEPIAVELLAGVIAPNIAAPRPNEKRQRTRIRRVIGENLQSNKLIHDLRRKVQTLILQLEPVIKRCLYEPAWSAAIDEANAAPHYRIEQQRGN